VQAHFAFQQGVGAATPVVEVAGDVRGALSGTRCAPTMRVVFVYLALAYISDPPQVHADRWTSRPGFRTAIHAVQQPGLFPGRYRPSWFC